MDDPASPLPAPTISITQSDGAYTVRARSLRSPITIQLVESTDIRKAVKRFSWELESSRPPGLPAPREQCLKFIDKAQDRAARCMAQIRQPGYKEDWFSVLNSILKELRSVNSEECAIEIVTDSPVYLPWEFLGFTEFDESGEVRQQRTVGLDTLCWRRFIRNATSTDWLQAHPLQVRMFRNVDLQATEREVDLFERRDYSLLGPIPERTPEQPLELADHLWNHTLPYNGIASLAHGDQIVHFACHNVLADLGADEVPDGNGGRAARALPVEDAAFVDSIIKLADEPHFWISARDLWYELDKLAFESFVSAATPKVLPMVFFNACRGQFQPSVTTSVAQVFFENGNRGFVGVVANIPDPIAARVSRHFYEALMQPMRAARALRYAKQRVLQEGSPLGLLYVYSGNPDLLPTGAEYVPVNEYVPLKMG